MTKKENSLLKPFPITSVCRQDIIDAGYSKEEVEKLTDSDMEFIASKIEDGVMESFWIALDIIMENGFFLRKNAK